MHDQRLEEQLRGALRADGDALPFTISTAELERRLVRRQGDRRGQRVSLMAAAVAVIAVAGIVGLGNGWVRFPGVGVPTSPLPSASSDPSPSPSVGPSLEPVPSPISDRLARLPELSWVDGSLDDWSTENPGQPMETDPTLVPFELDGVRLDARIAVLQIACLGDDARIEFGTVADPTAIASEDVVCDGTIVHHRWDVADRQPMTDQRLALLATRATAYRMRVNTLGMLSPSVDALPSLPPVDLPIAIDHVHEPDDGVVGQVMTDVGIVPPRGAYVASLVCLGTGDVRWEIGGQRLAGGGEQPCDGIARQVQVVEGVPPEPMAVLVHSDAGNAWHIVIGAFGEEPGFIAPPLYAWPGPEIVNGVAAQGLARCVAYDGMSDSCGLEYLPRDGAEVVDLAADRVIGLALAQGWQIRSVVVDARSRHGARLDPFGPALDRIAATSEGGREVTLELDALERGEWVARFFVTGSRDGETFSGVFEIPVRVSG